MITGKVLTDEVRKKILAVMPTPITGSDQVTAAQCTIGGMLVDQGYIMGSSSRTEFPNDLRALKVWDDAKTENP